MEKKMPNNKKTIKRFCTPVSCEHIQGSSNIPGCMTYNPFTYPFLEEPLKKKYKGQPCQYKPRENKNDPN